MCEVCEHRNKSNRAYMIIMVILFVTIGVLGTLVARFSHLLNNAYDLSRTNHVIACHIDTTLNNGQQILQCHDVKVSRTGGSK